MHASLAAFGGLQTLADAPAPVVLALKITAILLAAWLAHLALGRANPRWRVLLWRVAAVGLVALPAISWVLPALEIHVQKPPAEEVAALSAAPAAPVATPSSTQPSHDYSPGEASRKVSADRANEPAPYLVPEEPIPWPAEASSPPPTRTEAPAPARSESPAVSWPMMLLAVWLAGVGLLALRWSIGHYRIGQMVRRAKPAPAAICDACLRVARAVGCSSGVQVRQSARVESPLVCGFLRPVLLLPPRMCEGSYREDVPAILAHEMTHVRFHDLMWNAVLNLVAIVLWVHPLAWRVRRAHLAACELVCDGVSADFVGSVAEYCRTLARVAVESVAASSAAGIAMARTSSVSRRLAALRRKVFHKPLRGRSVAGFTLAVLVGVGALGALRFAMAVTEPEDAAASAPKADEKAAPEGKKQSATPTDSQPKPGSMLVRVVDESGKPLGGTKLTVWSSRDLSDRADYTTDAEGKTTVVVPTPNAKAHGIVAYPKGYPPMGKRWLNEARKEPIPAEFTFAYEKGRTIGGVIRDEEGKPIPQAKVYLIVSSRDYQQANLSVDLSSRPIETDAQGRWRCEHAPEKIDEISIRLEHAEYVGQYSWQAVPEAVLQSMGRGAAVMVMKKGIPVTGTVTDPESKPVAGATVALGDDRFGTRYPTVRTDQQGQYRFANLAAGDAALTVVLPDFAPGLRKISVRPDMSPVDFRLEKGHALRIKVVDEHGKPLPRVFIAPDTWRGVRTLADIGVAGHTDQEGRWSWNWAPSDAVEMNMRLSGFSAIIMRPFVPQETEHVVTLHPAFTVSGRVVEAETKQPLASFRVMPGSRRSSLESQVFWDREYAVEGKDGQFRLALYTQSPRPVWVRIEADGYHPAISREFKTDEKSVTCDFALRKGEAVTATVLWPDGRPAAGAEVRLFPQEQEAGPKMTLVVANGQISWPYRYGLPLTAGPDGRVTIQPQENGFVLVVLDEKGFAQVTSQQLAADPRIKLTAWARLEGVVRHGTKPAPGVRLFASYPIESSDPRWPIYRLEGATVTDTDGKFVFAKLIAGRVSVRVANVEPSRTLAKSLNLAPGQTLNITFGTVGRPVIGRIQWPGGRPPENGDLSRIRASVSSKLRERPSPPKAIIEQGPDAVRAWERQRMEAEAREPRRAPEPQLSPLVSVAGEGSVRMEDVVAGNHVFRVNIPLKDDRMLPWQSPERRYYACEFSVPDIPGGVSDEPLDLGSLAVAETTPQRPSFGSVQAPAPLAPAEKVVGPVREHLDLLRYIIVTHQENQAKIQTWQGKATFEQRDSSEKWKRGSDSVSTLEFVFDRAQRSVRWNKTVDKSTWIDHGRELPQSVPDFKNGMFTPEGYYSLYSLSPNVDPAHRPRTLNIQPTAAASGFGVDFIPLSYLETPPFGDMVRDLSAYLTSTDPVALGSAKVLRQGDLATVDTAGNSSSYRLTLNLAQGCNPVLLEEFSARVSEERPERRSKYRWTYELRDGIWLPKTWTETIHEENIRDLERKVTFIENRVNQPVEPEAFSLSRLGLKPGDNVDDQRTGQKYQYDGK